MTYALPWLRAVLYRRKVFVSSGGSGGSGGGVGGGTTTSSDTISDYPWRTVSPGDLLLSSVSLFPRFRYPDEGPVRPSYLPEVPPWQQLTNSEQVLSTVSLFPLLD